MKNPLFFDFSVDKTTNTITVKREFAAPVDLVWNAWTQADILDQWWAADGWKSFTKSMKFELDGHRHYRMDGPDETVFWGLTTYKHIVDQIEFGGDELFSDEQAQINKEYPQSSYKISFSEKNGHTFILHQTKYSTAKQMEDSLGFGFEKGTVDAYARLDGFLLKV